jgi:hypothetical protein
MALTDTGAQYSSNSTVEGVTSRARIKPVVKNLAVEVDGEVEEGRVEEEEGSGEVTQRSIVSSARQ